MKKGSLSPSLKAAMKESTSERELVISERKAHLSRAVGRGRKGRAAKIDIDSDERPHTDPCPTPLSITVCHYLAVILIPCIGTIPFSKAAFHHHL
jgi:hypothetical protein